MGPHDIITISGPMPILTIPNAEGTSYDVKPSCPSHDGPQLRDVADLTCCLANTT